MATNARDPALTAIGAVANVDLGLDPDAHAEVKLEGGGGQSERGGNIVIIEVMEKVVGRDPILHGGLIARTLEQMLALAGRVLRTHLVAVDAFGGQALVTLLGLELDKGRMDLCKRDLGQVGVGLLGLLAFGGRSTRCTRHGTDMLRNRGSGAMGGARAVNTSIGGEAQVCVLVRVQGRGLGIDTGRAGSSSGRMLVLHLATGCQVGIVTASVLAGTVAMTVAVTVAVTVTARTMRDDAAAVAARDVGGGAIMTLRMLLQRRLDGSSGLGVLGEVLGALSQMLLLPGGVLCADLVTEEALN